MEEPRQSPSLVLFFLIALLLHQLLNRIPIEGILGPQTNPSNLADKNNEPKEIVVEPLKEDNRQIVQTEKLPENDKLKDKKARFLGEFKNRVEKETQSPTTGKFQPTVPGGTANGDLKGDNGKGPNNRSPGEQTPESDEGDEVARQTPGGKSRLGLSELLGRNPYKLPDDVPNGGQTLLNTDPIIYASFINRIADEVRDPWVRFAQEAVLSRRKLEPNAYVTQIMIVVNRKGDVTEIELLKSCGIKELDDAPKKAFWEIGNFPNPPSQMVSKDGYIHFPFTFYFDYKTSFFNVAPII